MQALFSGVYRVGQKSDNPLNYVNIMQENCKTPDIYRYGTIYYGTRVNWAAVVCMVAFDNQ